MNQWTRSQVRRLFRVVNGGTPSSEIENWDGEVPWATPVDLGRVNGGHLTSTDRSLTTRGLATGSRAVPSGSIVVSTRAPIGYVAETTVTMAFNQGCRGLVPSVAMDPRFFRYQFGAMAERLNAEGQGSTFVELPGDVLAAVEVVVPSVARQQAIADYLDAETTRIDALITKKRRLIDVLDESRSSLIASGVRGALAGTPQVPSRIPWAATCGRGWREAKLTLVATLGTGHTPSREHPEWWVDTTIPWITTGEVQQMRADRIEFITETREQISQLGIENSSAVLHPAGTVVLCRTASAGYSAIMGLDMATSQDFVTWTCGPLIEPRYLLLCLRAMRPDLLGRLAMGSTHKTIYMPDIESLRVPLPPTDEQRRIVDEVWRRLDRIHRVMDATAQQIDLLVERRQALITAAVTGELEVPGVAA